MPEVEITEEQYDYLEELREQIAEELVGPYGHVRLSDALQYLVDNHEGEVDPEIVQGETGDSEGGDAGGPSGNSDGSGGRVAGDENGAEPESDEAKLNSMMQLLDEYDDVWEKAGSESGYEVELPDESIETVKTKDDVRALLFRHYT